MSLDLGQKSSGDLDTLAAIRKLMGEITPGDWFWDSYSMIGACVPEGHPLDFFPGKKYENAEGLKPVNIAQIDGGPGQRGYGDELILDEAKANAYFISRAPEIVRWLMKMLEREQDDLI